MAYRYNSEKGKPYRNDTYTSKIPLEIKESAEQTKQKLETKFRLMITMEIAKSISKDESNLDEIIEKILEKPVIMEHYKGWQEKGLDLKELFKIWYRNYLPEIEKYNKKNGKCDKGIER